MRSSFSSQPTWSTSEKLRFNGSALNVHSKYCGSRFALFLYHRGNSLLRSKWCAPRPPITKSPAATLQSLALWRVLLFVIYLSQGIGTSLAREYRNKTFPIEEHAFSRSQLIKQFFHVASARSMRESCVCARLQKCRRWPVVRSGRLLEGYEPAPTCYLSTISFIWERNVSSIIPDWFNAICREKGGIFVPARWEYS